MEKQIWWKHLHWPEYGAELLGTACLIFAGLSAVVFDFGSLLDFYLQEAARSLLFPP